MAHIPAIGAAHRYGRRAPATKSGSLPMLVASGILLAACLIYYLHSISLGWRHSISDGGTVFVRARRPSASMPYSVEARG